MTGDFMYQLHATAVPLPHEDATQVLQAVAINTANIGPNNPKNSQVSVLLTALVVAGPGQLALHHDAPLPHLAPDMALVRTVAVAINPVDAKMLDYSPAVGAIHGYDFAGVVVGLGSEAPGHLSIGDRVAGAVHGNNSLEPCVGAFAQYVGATAELLLKIPDGMAFEEASTLGIGLATAGLVLFRELEIPVRIEDLIVRAADAKISPNAAPSGAWVLVSGGSTATGTRAIQMLKL
ncbi:putative protein TOXD [Glarea lozoyensis 74030]|uniref:Alcohol dehydrogenase-like N-terminal domain-containing protein n=1 Tax=Glarea lozoyensis (strain ATCC 74030 / MF5533) TaxID=1104152 RepID=H0EPR7_GLAL7|nr:putative protein TOXD [Glarea lozoyensis 74030]